MTTTRTRLAAALLLPLLALAACSSGSSDSSDSGGSAASSADVAAAPGAAAGGEGLVADSASGDSASGDSAAGAESTPTVAQPAIISTGAVSLSATDVADARAKVQQVADRYAGQVTDQETSTDDDGDLGYARMVLRIPARSFSDAMAALEGVADLVDSSTTSEDVSTQVIDVDERVKAARASIDRIRTLLTRAEKIGDVMAIESQLSSREADLNSLLRQQAHLADQTSLSTISVSIERRGAGATQQADDDTGFLAGLAAGWRSVRGFAIGLATVVGVLLPWTPVALLVGIPVWLVARRSRRTPRTTPSAQVSP